MIPEYRWLMLGIKRDATRSQHLNCICFVLTQLIHCGKGRFICILDSETPRTATLPRKARLGFNVTPLFKQLYKRLCSWRELRCIQQLHCLLYTSIFDNAMLHHVVLVSFWVRTECINVYWDVFLTFRTFNVFLCPTDTWFSRRIFRKLCWKQAVSTLFSCDIEIYVQ